MNNNENKLSKVTALSVLLCFVIGIAVLSAAPFIYNADLGVQTSSQDNLVNRLKLRTARIIQEIKKQKLQLEKYGQQKGFLLTGQTTGIAGASLQKLASDTIGRNNGKIQNYQLLTPEKEKGLVRISMSMTFSANILKIQKILHELETGTPFIFVENIVIQSQEGQSGFSNSFQRKTLQVTMKINAYLSAENRI